MCFNALIDGDYDEKPLAQLLREEVASAVKVGSVAALVVLGVLASATTPVWLIASATVGAVVLSIALHGTVLVAGVSLLRLYSHRTVGLSAPNA